MTKEISWLFPSSPRQQSMKVTIKDILVVLLVIVVISASVVAWFGFGSPNDHRGCLSLRQI
jgi:hypothetical protein